MRPAYGIGGDRHVVDPEVIARDRGLFLRARAEGEPPGDGHIADRILLENRDSVVPDLDGAVLLHTHDDRHEPRLMIVARPVGSQVVESFRGDLDAALLHDDSRGVARVIPLRGSGSPRRRRGSVDEIKRDREARRAAAALPERNRLADVIREDQREALCTSLRAAADSHPETHLESGDELPGIQLGEDVGALQREACRNKDARLIEGVRQVHELEHPFIDQLGVFAVLHRDSSRVRTEVRAERSGACGEGEKQPPRSEACREPAGTGRGQLRLCWGSCRLGEVIHGNRWVNPEDNGDNAPAHGAQDRPRQGHVTRGLRIGDARHASGIETGGKQDPSLGSIRRPRGRGCLPGPSRMTAVEKTFGREAQPGSSFARGMPTSPRSKLRSMTQDAPPALAQDAPRNPEGRR